MYKKIRSSSAYEEKYSYSRAVVIGDFILVSNTAGRNHATKEMPATPLGQIEQTLTNIEKALNGVGAGLEHIVRARIFIPNVAHHAEIMTYWGERFKGIDPAITLTASPLASTEYLVEVEVTAFTGTSADAWERGQVSLA